MERSILVVKNYALIVALMVFMPITQHKYVLSVILSAHFVLDLNRRNAINVNHKQLWIN